MTTALTLPINVAVGTFDAYLSAVNQMPRLTAEQETALALRFRDQNDVNAAKELILSNLRFVVYVARGYSGYGLPMSDIIQEGNIGLMKAVKRFDPSMGVRLVSFAVHWIKAEIHEYVIKNWRIVKIATTKAQRKLFFNLRKSKTTSGFLSKDEATVIADNLGVDLDNVYEMEKRLNGQDMSFGMSDDDNPEDYYIAPESYLQAHSADPALLLENTDAETHDQSTLNSALAELDARSLDIVSSRWLADQKATLHELADRYQVSAERIRQLEQNAMKKLKASMVLAA
jgi:RNA polymerase sigma-32 factor